MSEPLCDNLEALLQDTAKLIRSQVEEEDCCILGYSMGSLLAYVLSSDPAYGINASHLFLCAFQSPDLLKEKRFLLSDAASEEAFITKYGNIDERILKDPRFAEVFTKPLRNDFHCLSNYETKALAPVSCGITVIYGNEDYALADVEGWKRFTTQKTEIHSVPGTHFFLNECLDQVCEIMKQNCK